MDALGDPATEMAVYAALTFDIISEACSSPQTAEINIGAREDTLMKWVNLGLGIAAVFAALGVVMSKRKWPPLLGSGLAMLVVYAQYNHARAAGLAALDDGLPGTEQY